LLGKQGRLLVKKANHVFGESGSGDNAGKFFDSIGGTHGCILLSLPVIQSYKTETFHSFSTEDSTRKDRGIFGSVFQNRIRPCGRMRAIDS
jgi:hypothetical protein